MTLRHTYGSLLAAAGVDRFLLVCAKRSKALPFGGSPGQATLDELGDAVRIGLRFAEIQTTIPFSTKAASLWEAEYDRATGRWWHPLVAVVFR